MSKLRRILELCCLYFKCQSVFGWTGSSGTWCPILLCASTVKIHRNDRERRNNHYGRTCHHRLPTFALFSGEEEEEEEGILSATLFSRQDFFNIAASSSANLLLAPTATTAMTTTTTTTINPPSLDLLDAETTSKQCQNGALIPELAVPGAYNQACMNLPRRVLEFQMNNNNKDNNTKIQVTIQQLPSGSGKTGLAVWNSGLLLTRLLVALVTSSPASQKWWKDQTVLELGCGTGLVSIVAGKLGAAHVIATDGNPDVIDLAQSNVELNTNNNNNNDSTNRRPLLNGNNNNENESSSQSSRVLVETQVLSWGLLSAMDYSDVASVVVGSDLTYNSGTWRVLAETMATVLKDNGIVIYLSLGHDGFNVRAELDGFLSVARENGLLPVPAEQLILWKDDNNHNNNNDGNNKNNDNGGSSVGAGKTSTTDHISLSQLLDRVVSPLERQQVLQASGGASVVVLQKKQFLMKQQQRKAAV